MTANESLERRVTDHYASEPPMRAPDRVLLTALATIDTTRQRRGNFAPWRFTQMSTYAKLAAAAVVVLAVGAIGLATLQRGQPPGHAGPPVPTDVPSSTAPPSTAPPPTASVGPSLEPAPPLTRTFRSETHGITLAHPAGWEAHSAEQPWAKSEGSPNFASTFADTVADPVLDDHLFLVFASQPLGDETEDGWIERMMRTYELCTDSQSITVDGAPGRLVTCNEPLRAFVSDGRRGYAIALYRSGDDPSLQLESRFGIEFFNEVLASVSLRPGRAVDASAPPT